MMPRTGPGRDRVKKQGVWLAGAGLWIAIGAAVVLAPDRAGWVWPAERSMTIFAGCPGRRI
jgi:hypothetical protein